MLKNPKRKRRIMRSFRIHEISAVDHPAQEHARMAIMKRADKEEFPDMEMQKIGDEYVASFDTLEAAVEAIARVEGCPRWQAMSRAASHRPDLVHRYNREGERQVAKALERMRPRSQPPAVGEFDALVDAIARRDKCAKTEAMRRARAEDPGLFARYQAA